MNRPTGTDSGEELLQKIKFDNSYSKIIWSEESNAWLYSEGAGHIGLIPPSLLKAIMAAHKDAIQAAVLEAENKARYTIHKILSDDVDGILDYSDIEQEFVKALQGAKND